MDRRTTLKTGLLAGASTFFAPVLGSGLGAVTSALGSYSSNIATTMKNNEVHIRAIVRDANLLCDAAVREAAFPYEKVYAEGNILRFEHGGTKYTVENIIA